MKKTFQIAGLMLIVAATAALAHTGVKDPTVKAWMIGMGEIGDNTKVLGSMAKGEAVFDAEAARKAAGAIAEHAGQISVLFKEQAADPKSEALPVIWQTYSDFLVKADALEMAASAAASSIQAEGDLRPALAAIGGTCKACHQTYRLKK
ncbi:MAG: cytochrome c [Rhodobacteraceae bacterium]|nr:cytochrome c [Paracoccaceae bacterium]